VFSKKNEGGRIGGKGIRRISKGREGGEREEEKEEKVRRGRGGVKGKRGDCELKRMRKGSEENGGGGMTELETEG